MRDRWGCRSTHGAKVGRRTVAEVDPDVGDIPAEGEGKCLCDVRLRDRTDTVTIAVFAPAAACTVVVAVVLSDTVALPFASVVAVDGVNVPEP